MAPDPKCAAATADITGRAPNRGVRTTQLGPRLGTNTEPTGIGEVLPPRTRMCGAAAAPAGRTRGDRYCSRGCAAVLHVGGSGGEIATEGAEGAASPTCGAPAIAPEDMPEIAPLIAGAATEHVGDKFGGGWGAERHLAPPGGNWSASSLSVHIGGGASTHSQADIAASSCPRMPSAPWIACRSGLGLASRSSASPSQGNLDRSRARAMPDGGRTVDRELAAVDCREASSLPRSLPQGRGQRLPKRPRGGGGALTSRPVEPRPRRKGPILEA
mmetsp:Transcript_4437/g.12797  ORF Transcript_4437/g.12797 Transcript_4437/m.12797 type:complete len:272 (-) Transcript_4437:416-1231(-)